MRIIAALLTAVLAAQAAWAGAPSPVRRTTELHSAESMYLMGGKEHRSKKVLRLVVLIPPDMTDDELIAVSDHYRAKFAAKEIIHAMFWNDAAAYKRFISAEDEEDIPVEVNDHYKARYNKDPFRAYGGPVHHLQFLKPAKDRRFTAPRRTISY
ncbi:MAG: hypothetical protein Q8T11_12025 [Elusimicrobiota bacterium]|nr:hypothetical protein [Elusimicrobiota bacterium]